ncbi:MAG TPA: DALR domain-containing protein, partial [Anaerolineae bacterium]
PHHECEIAQSVNFSHEPYFARFWAHTAMVGFEGAKMSKSLGNLVMVDKLLDKYSPDAIRLYLARHHYRTPWEFYYKDLEGTVADCNQLVQSVQVVGGTANPLEWRAAQSAFENALDDDLNTPAACEILCRFAGETLSACDERRDVTEAQEWIRQAAGVLGLRLDATEPESRVPAGWNKHMKRFS